MKMSPLLAFYLGSHPDHRDRLLTDVLRQDDFRLEHTHAYIQWLFPLPEHSRALSDSPVLSAADLQAFRSDALLRDHMLVVFRRMLAFYGLAYEHHQVSKAPNWTLLRANWLTEPTHNNLRISRILKSLALVGLDTESRAFLACLQALCRTEPDCRVPAESLAHWARAAGDASEG